MATEMVAGLALDAEVSRRVFGVTLPDIRPGISASWMEGDAVRHWPHYSTKIADAWHLIRRFDHGTVAGAAPLEERIAFWQEIGRIVEWEYNTTWPEALGIYDLPLVICRAALQAMAECARARTKGGE